MSKSNGYPPAGYETFTPDELRAILKRQRNPRRMVDRHVNRIKASLDRGVFDPMNGQTMVFDDRGYLVNGQHRAAAHALAEKPLTILVVRGVTSGLAEIDTGRRRGLGDILGGLGWKNHNTVAAAAFILHSVWGGIDPFFGYSTQSRPIPVEMMTTVGKVRRKTMDWAAAQAQKALHNLYPPAAYCAVLYQAAVSDQAKAEEFEEAARKGVGLRETHPVFSLRRYFMGKVSSKGSDSRRAAYGVIVKAWNLFQSGSKATQLVLRSNEELPKVE